MGKSKRHQDATGVSDYNKPKKIKNFFKRAWYFICQQIYAILYVALISAIWIYVILNWDKCIDMQLFSRFNGNNILFIVGLILVILPFYDVEGKGFKIHKNSSKKIVEEYDKTRHQFEMQKLYEGVKIKENFEDEEDKI